MEIYFCDGKVNKILMEQAPPKDFGEVKYMEQLLECFNIGIDSLGIGGDEYIKPTIISTGG